MRLWKEGETVENETNTLAIARVVPQSNESPVSYLSASLMQDMLDIAETMGWERLAIWQTMKETGGTSPLTFAPKDADFGVAIAPAIYDD